MHNIAKNLKQVRQQRGWTQQQMADMLFVTRQTVSNWENGKSMPDIDMLTDIAEKLDVDVNELLYGPQPVNNSNIKGIRISLVILALCIFLELNKNYISMLCVRNFSMFDRMMSCFITLPLICFTGAILVSQLFKSTGIITRAIDIKHSKAIQYTMLGIYLVPLTIALPFILQQFTMFLYTWVREILGSQFASESKILLPGIKAATYFMQNVISAMNNTAFGKLSWNIIILITEYNIIYNIILIFAGFIYEITKPNGGRVRLAGVFNFDRLISAFNKPMDMVEKFKANIPANKKKIALLGVIFTFCFFASCIIGKNNDGYIISQLNKGLFIPLAYVSAGLIIALIRKTAELIKNINYQKTNRLFTAVTITALLITIAVYIPYLINDIIFTAHNAGVSFGVSPIVYLQKLMNLPDWYKYIYSVIEKLVTGSFKNKFIVYTIPAFIAGITKK